jgi:hypothetical protein
MTEKNTLDQFTPEIIGLFWMTPESLSRSLPFFSELNYLFDGLISEFLFEREKESEQAHIFFTQNFGQKFFLAHINTKGQTKSQIAGDIDEQISLITQNKEDRRTILIFDLTSDQWINEMQKRYSQFVFKKFES